MIKTARLSCGIPVLMETVAHTRTVSISLWILKGSRDERAQEKGFSHFLEHLFFKGTKKRSALQIVQEIDRVGGNINAFTEKEHICAYCTLPKNHISLAIDVLSDMLLHSQLPEEEFAREKLVITNEIREYEDSPEERAYDLFLSHMWGGHPLAGKITGEASDIENAGYKDIKRFYDRLLTPENFLVSIAGNFNADKVLDLLNEAFLNLSGKVFPVRRKSPVLKPAWEYVSASFSQVQVYVGTSFPVFSEVKDFYHFFVLSTVMGESMSSRLFQHLRERKGLCYSIFSLRSFFSCTGLWCFYANTSPELLNPLLKALEEEIRSLRNEPPLQEEIDDAVSHLAGGMILSMEDMETRMKRMVRHYLQGEIIHTVEESIEYLKTTAREDLEKLSRHLLDVNRLNLLAFGTRNLHKRKKYCFIES